jgi:hypothetical protein
MDAIGLLGDEDAMELLGEVPPSDGSSLDAHPAALRATSAKTITDRVQAHTASSPTASDVRNHILRDVRLAEVVPLGSEGWTSHWTHRRR